MNPSTSIAENLSSTVGHTPLVRLNRISQGAGASILLKIESMNPLGSVKDRIAVAMVDDAEKKGQITPGKSILVEPTSGNTGIALAFVAAARGYKLVLAMPDTMSNERRKILAALGAELILTPGSQGMTGAVQRARQLQAENPDAFLLHQFSNPANPETHRKTTGPEIWASAGGQVDILVAGVGTGGTISGTGKFLKEKNPSLKVIAVEPKDSPVISQTLAGKEIQPGPHKIQGIGPGFIPDNLDLSIVDEVITVANDDAFETGRRLAKQEGVFAGISTGANVYAAMVVAGRPENIGKTVVTIACSTGERYISTVLFECPS